MSSFSDSVEVDESRLNFGRCRGQEEMLLNTTIVRSSS